MKRARCKWCGAVLRRAWIPNRGLVMAHGKGERERCDRLVELGQDLVSREIRRLDLEAETLRRREQYKINHSPNSGGRK